MNSQVTSRRVKSVSFSPLPLNLSKPLLVFGLSKGWYLIKGSARSLLLITILMDSWTDFDSSVAKMTWLVRNLTGCGENYLTVGWIDLIIGSFHSFCIFSHNIRSCSLSNHEAFIVPKKNKYTQRKHRPISLQ